MSLLRRAIETWRQDALLRKVLRNTSYLFSSNTLTMGLSMVQSIFAARLLGVEGFGILGAVTTFASNVNRLFSFRMGELVVKYVGQFTAQGEKERASAVLKAAALAETATSLVAYLLLVLLAPFAARFFAKDASLAPLFSFYALALLANFVTETATAVLQLGDHYRSQAAINLFQSLLTAGVIFYAFLVNGDMWMVVTAYLLGKAIIGLSYAGLAFWRARQMLGAGWWRAPFHLLPERRSFWGFAFSSNFSGTVNLVTRDSEILWVNWLLSPTEGGYYKVAWAVINPILMPINPFITTSFPEIARTVGQRAWGKLRDLLRRLTIISAAWTGLAVLGLVLLGDWLIRSFYGQAFSPATPAALILLVGFGTANILYWNRTLLLSLGHPTFPLVVIATAGLVKVVLTLWLVPRFGYLAQAALMSAFLAVSVVLIVLRGVREIRAQMEAA